MNNNQIYNRSKVISLEESMDILSKIYLEFNSKRMKKKTRQGQITKEQF